MTEPDIINLQSYLNSESAQASQIAPVATFEEQKESLLAKFKTDHLQVNQSGKRKHTRPQLARIAQELLNDAGLCLDNTGILFDCLVEEVKNYTALTQKDLTVK